MSAFKDMVETDITSVFINFDEFGSEHTIDGRTMTVVVDENELQQRSDKNGVQLGNMLFYANTADFTRKPEADQTMFYDGKSAIIMDCTEDMGVYAVTLNINY